MSNIEQAQKNLKKKLSFSDYNDVQVEAESTPCVEHQQSCGPQAVADRVGKKIKVTYYLSEEDHDALTEMYISRMQQKQKTDRSALVAQAIRLLYEQEKGKK